MTGDRLKEIIAKHKVSQSEIARRLGMSHQSFHQMLSAADIKSSLIERVAAALGVPVSSLFSEQSSIATASGTGNVAGNNNVVGSLTIGNASVLQERVSMLEKLLEEKERTIKILMER